MLGGKNPLICFGICKQLSQILTGTEHEQAKLIQVPGDTQKSICEARTKPTLTVFNSVKQNKAESWQKEDTDPASLKEKSEHLKFWHTIRCSIGKR